MTAIQTNDEDLVARLVAAAGETQRGPAVRLPGPGRLNRHWRVPTSGGLRVARLYGWPFETPEPPDRGATEARLLSRLADAQAPVPKPFAGEPGGLLLSFVAGERLSDLGSSDPAAWRAAGEGLRGVHEAAAPAGSAAPVDSAWGDWVLAVALRHIELIGASHPEIAAGMAAARASLVAGVPALAGARSGLVHGDAHAGNVLLRRDSSGWVCAAWLDWEFARIGDPEWDVVQALLTGPGANVEEADAWHSGYGRAPDPARAGVYALAIALRLASDSLHLPDHPAAPAAWRHLATCGFTP